MLVPFYSADEACKAVSAIFKAGITPSALEFMERDAIDLTIKFLKDDSLKIDKNIQANLLIEVDGSNPDVLLYEIERIIGVLDKYSCGEILFAEDEAQKDKLWQIRRMVGEAVKASSIYKEEDTVVPRYELAKLLKGVKQIGKDFGFQSVCYGHAGDGNLHINILKNDIPDYKWNKEIKLAIRKIFELTVSLNGTISGEHGIGYVQKEFMDIPFKPIELDIMREIKRIFDPHNILNPGKIF